MTTKHHPATRRLAGAVAIVLACLCTALSAQADRYLTENFDYPPDFVTFFKKEKC